MRAQRAGCVQKTPEASDVLLSGSLPELAPRAPRARSTTCLLPMYEALLTDVTVMCERALVACHACPPTARPLLVLDQEARVEVGTWSSNLVALLLLSVNSRISCFMYSARRA